MCAMYLTNKMSCSFSTSATKFEEDLKEEDFKELRGAVAVAVAVAVALSWFTKWVVVLLSYVAVFSVSGPVPVASDIAC